MKIKTKLMLLSLVAFSGVAQADIWANDFTGTITWTDANPVIVGDTLTATTDGTWGRQASSRAYIKASNDELWIRPPNTTATRAAVVALADSVFTSGSYTLNYSASLITTSLRVDVWDARSFGDTYSLNTGDGTVGADGANAEVSLLATTTILSSDTGATGPHSLNFNYDGTGDVVLTFTGAGNANIGPLSIIPEPATLGLVVAMGGGLLFIRRRFQM